MRNARSKEVLNMITEKEKKNRNELFRLMRENPDLPVIPMVDSEICGGDFAYYMGCWGRAEIDEILICENDYERIEFKSDHDVYGTLYHYLKAEQYDELPDNDDLCEEIYNNLPWKEAIVVLIVHE